MVDKTNRCWNCECVSPFSPRPRTEDGKVYWVECPCGLRTGDFWGKEAAVARWNRRHITAADVPESVKREIQAEALESLIDGKPGPFLGFSWIRGLITKLREGD